MRFLVLGCNGMAGHMITLYLHEQGYDVTGFAKEKSKFVDTIVGDVTDFLLLKDVITQGNYDSVINCVGLLNQFAENNHPMAVLLNGYLPPDYSYEYGLRFLRKKRRIYGRFCTGWDIIL